MRLGTREPHEPPNSIFYGMQYSKWPTHHARQWYCRSALLTTASQTSQLAVGTNWKEVSTVPFERYVFRTWNGRVLSESAYVTLEFCDDTNIAETRPLCEVCLPTALQWLRGVLPVPDIIPGKHQPTVCPSLSHGIRKGLFKGSGRGSRNAAVALPGNWKGQ